MQILLITIAALALFSGGYYLETAFSSKNRLQFHLAGLAMLAGVVVCVLILEYQMLRMWYIFILLSIPTSTGYIIASTGSINR
jgi:uncharacterized membrane protein